MGFHDKEILLVLHGLAFLMGRRAFALLWAFIEESRLEKMRTTCLSKRESFSNSSLRDSEAYAKKRPSLFPSSL